MRRRIRVETGPGFPDLCASTTEEEGLFGRSAGTGWNRQMAKVADDLEADEMMSRIRVRVERRAALYCLRGPAGTADLAISLEPGIRAVGG